MELHESLRLARSRAGLTGVKMASMLGITAPAYLRYERGEVVPAADLILKMAGELGCSPSALMLTGGGESTSGGAPRKRGETLDVTLAEGETVKIEINIRPGR